MMKQMKLFTVALMCMMMQTMVCNANHDVMISVSQLPSAAKTFVQKQFPGKKILYAQQDGNFKAKFETRLDDGTEIGFDRIGKRKKIELGKNRVQTQCCSRSSRPRPHPQPSERQLPWCRHP